MLEVVRCPVKLSAGMMGGRVSMKDETGQQWIKNTNENEEDAWYHQRKEIPGMRKCRGEFSFYLCRLSVSWEMPDVPLRYFAREAGLP